MTNSQNMTDEDQTETALAAVITEQNDRFRTSWGTDPSVPGQIVMTRGIADLSPAAQAIIVQRVVRFCDFTEDNDPYATTVWGCSVSRLAATTTASSGKSTSTIQATGWAAMTPLM